MEDDNKDYTPDHDPSPSPSSGAEPDTGEETEMPPAQPPGGEDTPHDPDAPDESTQDEEGAGAEVEDSSMLDETEAQPDVSASDEVEGSAKQPFHVVMEDPPGTAKQVAALIGQMGVYQRGGKAVTLWGRGQHGLLEAKKLDAEDVASLVHAVMQPYTVRYGARGPRREDIALPVRVAKLALSSFVGMDLPQLNGVAYGPLLSANGTIRHTDGYDHELGLYCHNTATVTVPNRATRRAVEAALQRLRKRVRTFPFADSVRVKVSDSEEPVVDIEQPPGADESICLTALLTAACRASLGLVPGLLIGAPYLAGAGAGKGLMVRFIAEVAYGLSPTAMTTGERGDEFDKRLASALMKATPIILLDNVNATELRSNLLASAITENPAEVRVLGTSTLVQLNSSAFICVTGNGLSVTEDLRRRFLEVRLNPGVENPEARSFTGDFLAETRRDRGEILSDVLTIVTWGLQQGDDLPRGRPLGSFEQWGRMCRDPLLALGCKDAVEEMANRQAGDSERAWLAEFFEAWWHHHGNRQVTGKDLHGDVWDMLAPYGENRQNVARKLMQLDGATCNGFRLQLIEMAGKWSPHRYRLECADSARLDQGHRRGGGNNGQHETGDGLDGLGGPTRPLPVRRN
jgi:hypothetical protein